MLLTYMSALKRLGLQKIVQVWRLRFLTHASGWEQLYLCHQKPQVHLRLLDSAQRVH